MARTTRGLHGARAAPLPSQQNTNIIWTEKRDSNKVAVCTASSHNNVVHLHAADSAIRGPNVKDNTCKVTSKRHSRQALGAWQVSIANGHPSVCGAAAICDRGTQHKCFSRLIFV
jgi:hypothetical protein